MAADLIQHIESPAAASPGDPIKVAVKLSSDAPPDTSVVIYGMNAREVTIQAPGRLGVFRIPIVASSSTQVQQSTVEVVVSGTPSAPLLALTRNPFLPLGVVLRVGDIDPSHPLLASGDRFEWQIGPSVAETAEPLVAHDLSELVDHTRMYTPLDVAVRIRHADGTTHTAQRTLVVGSDYRLLRDELGQIRPPVRTDGSAVQDTHLRSTYKGSLTITNLEPTALHLTTQRVQWLADDGDATYAPDVNIDLAVASGASAQLSVDFDRSQAPAGSHGATVYLVGSATSGEEVVTSATFDFVRSEPLRLPDVPALMNDPTLLEKIARTFTVHDAQPAEPVAIHGAPSVPADRMFLGQEHIWALNLLGTPLGSGTSTMSSHGQSPGLGQAGLNVHAPWLTDVHRWLGAIHVGPAVFALHENISEGAPCDPDNLPDAIPEFFACQYTGEMAEQLIPGRIVNARRGDIVLVPGGNGLIGGLLAHVQPSQRYAHCGIMTKNFTEISHATASTDWLKDHARGVHPLGGAVKQPTDGFEPEALRFQWPGAITQSVESAYSGSFFTGPDGFVDAQGKPKTYRLAAFNLIDGAFIDEQWQLIPPLVVKPHPLAEHNEPDLRVRAHAVADKVRELCVTEDDTAQGRQSKIHYRFYCYTDAAIAVRDANGVAGLAPPDSGWAAGTLPAVCSSLIWLGARAAGEQLEGPGPMSSRGDLEPSPDLLASAQVDPDTFDGLYLYTEHERQSAASWLFDYLIDSIFKTEQKEGGWFGGILNEAASDMADDCANQILNTFASDWADGDAKNSDRWTNPGMGRAVSPDNLLLWDQWPWNEPDKPRRGIWGYVEPLVYHQARVERVPVTKWHQTTGPGVVTGLVRFDGKPVPGANISAGGPQAPAGADGRFSLTLLEGRYLVKADAYLGDAVGVASGSVDTLVKLNETTDVVIDLSPPPDRYRLVRIDAQMSFRDDEFTLNPFEDDPDEYDSDRKYWEFRVHSGHTHEGTRYEKGWGGECRIEAELSADLENDLSITVNLSGDLFEGTTENTNQRKGQGNGTWRIAKDQTATEVLRIKSENEDDTYAEFSLTITNRADL